MSNWSLKNKLTYLGPILILLFLFIFIPYIFRSYEAPTCFDKKNNQDELGIDCGGSCKIRCDFQITEPVVLWSKPFKITNGFYSAVALIENPNIGSETKSIDYIFRLKDASGVVLDESKGTTFIPNLRNLAFFESGFRTDKKPLVAEFEFVGNAVWESDQIFPADIAVRSKNFSKINESPRLDVQLENKSFRDIERLEVIVIIYGSSGNSVGVSRTFIDQFKRDDVTDIVFTWPLPFEESPTVIDIFTKIVP